MPRETNPYSRLNVSHNEPAGRDGPSPRELLETLSRDVPPVEAEVRVGNARPERVPIRADPRDPARYFVMFRDLSADTRRILDRCPEVEVRVDGVTETGGRAFVQDGPRRAPVLEWRHE
jgi:hypothetical protein